MARTSIIGLGFLMACSPGATPNIAPILLTPTEYNNSVRDLLGMPDAGADWPDAPAVLELVPTAR